MLTATLNKSVWARTQSRSYEDVEPVDQDRDGLPGRLVAVTSTGPIYRVDADLVVLPVASALAFIQELAARALNPKAHVVSSLANRVAGDEARATWANTCGIVSGQLIQTPPEARLQFLSEVLSYIRRQGNANGIEPVLCAAMNAAWPWIDPEALARILALCAKYLARSEFAAAEVVPVADPNTRTFTVFSPGDLARVDVDEWRDWQALNPGYAHAVPNDLKGVGNTHDSTGGTPIVAASDVIKPSGPDADRVPRRDGRSREPGDDYASLSGGVIGPGGPNLDRLPGPDGRQRDDEMDESVRRRLNLGRLPGRDGRARDDVMRDEADLSAYGLPKPGGLPNARSANLDYRANGGPYGYGPTLGSGGTEDAYDEMKSTGSSAKTFGMGVMAWGGAAALSAIATKNPALGGVAAMAIIEGYLIFDAGRRAEEMGAAKPEPAPTPAPVEPPTSAPSTIDVHKLPDAKPKPPKHTDLYPNPDGGGGGPTTIWDENGGGGGPTTAPLFVGASLLTGRGLLSSVIQVGPTTFSF